MHRRLTAALFAATIFVSAFLLFQIQPLISRCLLPWFGGTPNVWTTCMLFFQAVLFAGYVYAHLLSSRLQPTAQALVHLGLLGTTVVLLQILPGAESQPDPQGAPAAQILALLAVTVGLPYFLLSTTGPLLQAWFARSLPGESPFRLYALSNVGSLLALVSYPFVFEPAFGMSTQATLWSWGFFGFVILCSVAAWRASRGAAHDAMPLANRSLSASESGAIDSAVTDPDRTTSLPGAQSAPAAATLSPARRAGRPGEWFALAMIASVLLLATTNQVCLDVAVVPFLWVVPLGLYLLTFILAFDREEWYSRRICGLAGAVAMVLATLLMLQSADTSLVLQVLVAFGGMFLGCLVCHGELVRRRPEPARLTQFYLVISAGGAAGGLFVGLIAPLIFPLYLEMHLAIAVCCALTLAVWLQEQGTLNGRTPRLLQGVAGLTLIGVVLALQSQASGVFARSEAVRRNFFGVLRVERHAADASSGETLSLRYGRVLHGMQFVAADQRRHATTYFGPDSGVGRLLLELQSRRPGLRIGVVGLGVGTLAAYGRESDFLRFYEINLDVIDLAREHFTFLADCPSRVEIVTGDARLSLERETDAPFDVLILDAFSGDAIPTHLLTAEALAVYRRRLAADGVLAIHISNLHFDLRPVAAALAEQAGFAHRLLISAGDRATGQTGSVWSVATAVPDLLDAPRLAPLVSQSPRNQVRWTDDFSNVFQLLK